MKDKLTDIFLTIKEKIQDLLWVIQDNLKTTLYGVLLAVFVVMILFILNQDSSTYSSQIEDLEPNSEEQLQFMTESSEELKEIFSELEIRDVSTNPKQPMLDISLYLKRPFIDPFDLENYLNTYLDLLKLKYNDDDDKTYLKGVRVTIYDRKLIFDEGLEPAGSFYYMLSSSLIEESEDEFDEITNIKEEAWKITEEQTKKPKYQDYETSFDFYALENNPSIQPLTDAEFAWFLKFNQYVALGGSIASGANLYLQWELGVNTDRDGFVVVVRSFEKFVSRLSEIGAFYDYYPSTNDVDMLKQKLVIENPQFLLYAEMKELEDDPMEARKKLVQERPEIYTLTVDDWIKQQSINYSEVIDPASQENDENKTNSQLLSEEEIENQDEDILNQSSDVDKPDE